MMAEGSLPQAVAAAIDGEAGARSALSVRITANPLQQALFARADAGLDAHLRLFEQLLPTYDRTMRGFVIEHADPGFLFDFLLPLARFLSDRIAHRSGAYLIGLGGGPGAGKSTLSRLLAACLPQVSTRSPDCLSLSLDDFYRPKAERLRRGFKWRTLPGTHDTERLQSFVTEFDRRAAPFSVPRYDLGRDAPAPDEVRPEPPDVCIFDGAMVGSTLPGYGGLARRIDMMIYLDAEVALLKRWRFERERRIRERSGGAAGFSPQEMRAFWDEALGPSLRKWVRPNAKHADLVIEIGPGRAIRGARMQAGQVAEVLGDG